MKIFGTNLMRVTRAFFTAFVCLITAVVSAQTAQPKAGGLRHLDERLPHEDCQTRWNRGFSLS